METKLYNLEILKITTEDDIEFLTKILSTFLNSNRNMVNKLKTFYQEKDLLQIGEVAHKMLGSYKHLEINSVIPQLTELEGLTAGKNIDLVRIRSLIEHITKDSELVFSDLDVEISEIKNL